MRPPSIVLFERVYLVGIALSIVTAILWVLYPPVIVLPPNAPPAVAQMTGVVTVVSMAIGIAIAVTLLYFIARRGSDVARWIFVVLFVIGLVGIARQFAPHVPVVMPPGARILGFVQLAIQAMCVWLVFRPDAKPWFGPRIRS